MSAYVVASIRLDTEADAAHEQRLTTALTARAIPFVCATLEGQTSGGVDAETRSGFLAQVREAHGVPAIWLDIDTPEDTVAVLAQPEAVPHTRSLFGPGTHPYYLAIDNFRASSAGVWSMHLLCHALNSAGYEAYIASAGETNPDWQTPNLTEKLLAQHQNGGLTPIVVYPEIVTGNPFNAEVIARYVLNTPGKLTGHGMEEGPEDLLFYYSPQFIGDQSPADVDFLLAPTMDPKVFHPDPSITRDRVLVYQHRFPRSKVDLSLFPPGAELLTLDNPLSLPELARLFQSTKVLYSYELSGTCTMAMAAGCPVIYRPEGDITELPSTFLFGNNGAAMANEPGGLERATATVGIVSDIIAGMEATFWTQLRVFIDKTQAAARERHALKNAALADN